jgi:predicted DNA-binding protein (UPF0251 family)
VRDIKPHQSIRIMSTESYKEREIKAQLENFTTLIKDLIEDNKKLRKKLSDNEKEFFIPLSAFKTNLSSLETIAVYLRDEKKLRFTEIAKILNRDQRTIWHSYNRAKKKKEKIDVKDNSTSIPISIFSDRKYSVLESIIAHLKKEHDMTFTKIGEKLSRSPKTIWATYQRYLKKNES